MSTAFRLSVSGSPDGDVSTDWLFDGGQIAPDTSGTEPVLTMTMEYKDFERMANGQLLPTVAYMQGLLKSTGDNGAMLEVLAHSATPEFETWRAQL